MQAFKNCLKENDIDPKDVIFVAHSTTQATNALIEGDVAQVGVIGIGGKGPGGWIAKAQTNLKDIDLGSGRSIHLHNRYLVDDTLSDASVKAAIQELTGEGAQVIVASEVYGVDDMENETGVCGIAKQMGAGGYRRQRNYQVVRSDPPHPHRRHQRFHSAQDAEHRQ